MTRPAQPKRQRQTPAILTSQAANSARKGLQQYFTPQPWATALAAALPSLRRSILDLHCGDGSLLRGIANQTTREVMSLDIDPTAHPGKPKAWAATRIVPPLTAHYTGDVLDIYPLLIETHTRFDLITLNPPFSLQWPLTALPEPLRKGLTGKSISSTHATIRMLPSLLNPMGEALLIANHNTLKRLYRDFPDDFRSAWLWVSIPSFYPGVDRETLIGVLYLSANHDVGPLNLKARSHLGAHSPADLARDLDILRRDTFSRSSITQPWETTPSFKDFTACGNEMERRRDPTASRANITLTHTGHISIHISPFQQRTESIPHHLYSFLDSLHRKHPLELTLQRGTRLALKELLDAGIWTIAPNAQAALDHALQTFERDRAPLSPITSVQTIGWIDDAEELLCTQNFDHFSAGQRYKLSTETIEWKKEENRPRYHAGKRDTETVLVRGTDLRLTLHHPSLPPVHFIFNPERTGTLHTTYSLEDLANHFQLPDAPDITALHPQRFAANLALLDHLESITP